MFTFRIATRQGVGHLMRMKWLAKEFIELGHKVVFIVDSCQSNVLDKIRDLDVVVRQVDVAASSYNLQLDAEYCLQALQEFDCRYFVIDSYWHGIEFETYFDAYTRVVFDDIEREHQCDLLFDQKWQGQETTKRYLKKVPNNCQRYLGPAYSMLAPEYAQSVPPKLCEKNTVLYSLGGGGDLQIVTNLLKELAPKTPNIDHQVVIGPQATNTASVSALASEFDNIQCHVEPHSLYPLYLGADLFVGALGTSLYELAATELPAVTFELAENQHNDIVDLETLGHFFHLGQVNALSPKTMARLVKQLLDNLDRVRKLRACADLTIDGLGTKRVASKILQQPLLENLPQHSRLQQTKRLTRINKVDFTEKLDEQFNIRSVNDADINRYRLARNLPNNAQRMTINDEIPAIDHYIWWLSNSRQSFVLEENNQAILYIWHDEKVINDQTYLFGGWFTAQKDIPFNVAMMALSWQLRYSKQQTPEAIWLAVIHKENKFVNLLNKYMGFTETAPGSIAYATTESIFPKASEQKFNFVLLPCQDFKF